MSGSLVRCWTFCQVGAVYGTLVSDRGWRGPTGRFGWTGRDGGAYMSDRGGGTYSQVGVARQVGTVGPICQGISIFVPSGC
jgi:hypothetical protein